MKKVLPMIYGVVIVAVTAPMFYTQLSLVDNDSTSATNPTAIADRTKTNAEDSVSAEYLQATHFKIAPHRLRLAQYVKGTKHKTKRSMLQGHLKLQPVPLLVRQQ
jgi:hypothetical protein